MELKEINAEAQKKGVNVVQQWDLLLCSALTSDNLYARRHREKEGGGSYSVFYSEESLDGKAYEVKPNG